MRREAHAAFVTRVEFLYASGMLSRCLVDTGATPTALDPSSGSVITTGSMKH